MWYWNSCRLVLFLLIVVAPSLPGQSAASRTVSAGFVFSEDFNVAPGTLLTSAGWTQSGPTATNPIMTVSPGLAMTGCPGSGDGNAAVLTTSGQDVYASFPPVNSGSVYLSFLLQPSAVGSGDYFIALSPATSQTSYYARVHLKSSASGYLVGISKNNEVSGGGHFGSTVLPFGTTAFIVVKYTFAPLVVSTDTANDPISVFVFTSSIPATEPGSSEIASYLCPSKSDAANFGSVTLRQGSAGAAPALTIDAIRIGTNWPTEDPAGVPLGTDDVPRISELRSGYPNPFNPTTKIGFTVAKDGAADLKVCNMLGQEIATLFNGFARAGTLNVRTFEARNLPTGVYFSVLSVDGQQFVKKLVMMK